MTVVAVVELDNVFVTVLQPQLAIALGFLKIIFNVIFYFKGRHFRKKYVIPKSVFTLELLVVQVFHLLLLIIHLLVYLLIIYQHKDPIREKGDKKKELMFKDFCINQSFCENNFNFRNFKTSEVSFLVGN